MSRFKVHACTDVTGFGLLGHLAEMVSGSGKGVRLFADQVPVLSEAFEFAAMGLIPAGAYRNREFRAAMVQCSSSVPRNLQDILVDPQTSGGLLISVSADQADDLVSALKGEGIDQAVVVGEVDGNLDETIHVA